MKRNGFTLIELLIVVAIIGILAAIAIPNFLQAQTRAKVAHAQSELRNATVAIESYYVDYDDYPYTNQVDVLEQRWKLLTTPIAYFTGRFSDPFGDDSPLSVFNDSNPLATQYATYDFITDYPPNPLHHAFFVQLINRGYPPSIQWYTASQGPDGTIGVIDFTTGIGLPYDPTNGTISGGDVLRTGP